MSGPGVVSARPESVHGLRVRDPAVGLDGGLRHVREHGVRAAERDERRLREEAVLLREEAVRPDHATTRRTARSTARLRRRGSARARPTTAARRIAPRFGAESAAVGRVELRRRLAAASKDRGRSRDPATPSAAAPRMTAGNGTCEEEERDERGGRDRSTSQRGRRARRPIRSTAARTSATTTGFKPGEDAGDQRDGPVRGVDRTTAPQDEDRWEHEERARDEAARASRAAASRCRSRAAAPRAPAGACSSSARAGTAPPRSTAAARRGRDA